MLFCFVLYCFIFVVFYYQNLTSDKMKLFYLIDLIVGASCDGCCYWVCCYVGSRVPSLIYWSSLKMSLFITASVLAVCTTGVFRLVLCLVCSGIGQICILFYFSYLPDSFTMMYVPGAFAMFICGNMLPSE